MLVRFIFACITKTWVAKKYLYRHPVRNSRPLRFLTFGDTMDVLIIAIIGAVVGVIVLLAIAGVVGFVIFKMKSKPKQQTFELTDDNPFMVDQPQQFNKDAGAAPPVFADQGTAGTGSGPVFGASMGELQRQQEAAIEQQHQR